MLQYIEITWILVCYHNRPESSLTTEFQRSADWPIVASVTFQIRVQENLDIPDFKNVAIRLPESIQGINLTEGARLPEHGIVENKQFPFRS